MKKIYYIIFFIILSLSLVGCSNTKDKVIKENSKEQSRKMIKQKIINNLSETEKIIINSSFPEKNTKATITNKETINEVIEILSKAYNDGGTFLCDGTTIYLEMFDNDNKLIDTINIWINGRMMPQSISSGCTYYYIDQKNMNPIIEKHIETKFFSLINYVEDCNNKQEIIYEDKDYKYYFTCYEKDKVFIEFITTGVKMTLKEALNNKHIKIDDLIKSHPDYVIKKEITFDTMR